MNKCINLRTITSSDESQVRNYAESCSWRAGKTLASAMEHNESSDWERVIVAVDNEKICGTVRFQKRTVFRMRIVHLISALCLLTRNTGVTD